MQIEAMDGKRLISDAIAVEAMPSYARSTDTGSGYRYM